MIKIAIFEDNASRREGLRLLIDAMEGMECTGAHEDCTDIVAHVAKEKPDVILMDINMPNVDGIEGLKLVKAAFPEIKVIMSTIFEEENKILEAISAGADGYLLKQNSPLKLLDGIVEVMNNGAPMTPTVAKKVLKLLNKQQKSSAGPSFDLTQREQEILGLLVEGYSYKMIAGKIFVTYATVNKHISNIYSKLQVKSVAAAVSKAVKEGLV
jgi:DNA-binding NarL/FixJ family response regulator